MRNWIKRTTHIYRSDSEEDLQQEEENEVEKEETSEGTSTTSATHSKEEEDNDQDSEVRAERICSPEQGGVSSKRPRKTYKIKRHKYRRHLRKAEKASEEMSTYRISRLPFIMGFSKLLALLYLAVLLAEENFLLSDIIR